MTNTETGNATGTKDKTYNILWVHRSMPGQCAAP